MEEARPRFVEAAQIVVKALTQDVFDWDGEFFKIPRDRRSGRARSRTPSGASTPRRSARSRPRSWPSSASACWSSCRTSGPRPPRTSGAIARSRQSVGHTPRPPIILTNVSVAESRDGGHERAVQYLGAQVGFDRRPLPLLGRPPGHGEGLRVLRRDGQDVLQDEGRELPQEGHRLLRQDPGGRHARRLHPADRRAAHGSPGWITWSTEFAFGGMPHEEAELNMRLFAERVMPVLQRDHAFANSRGSNGADTASARCAG